MNIKTKLKNWVKAIFQTSNWEYSDKQPIRKTTEITIKEAGNDFDKIGPIIIEGQNRGFTKEQVAQLIIGKVIRL